MKRMNLARCGAIAALALGCGGDPSEPAEVATTLSAVDPTLEAPEPEIRQNRRPSIDWVHLSHDRPRPGEIIRAEVSASDPEGDSIEFTYEWRIDGNQVKNAGSGLSVPPLAKDSRIEVTVVANDGAAWSEPESATARVANQPPRVLQVVLEPLGEITAANNVTASPRAVDPDGDPLDFRYTWLVNGSAVGGNRSTLDRSHYERGDHIVIRVVASDRQDESEPLVSAPIEVANGAPRITSAPGAIDDDGVFRYQIGVEDPDGDRLFRYRLTEGPRGMDLDIDSGLIEWSPTEDQVGSHRVAIEIDDRKGGEASQSFQVQIDFEEQSVPAAAQP